MSDTEGSIFSGTGFYIAAGVGGLVVLGLILYFFVFKKSPETSSSGTSSDLQTRVENLERHVDNITDFLARATGKNPADGRDSKNDKEPTPNRKVQNQRAEPKKGQKVDQKPRKIRDDTSDFTEKTYHSENEGGEEEEDDE